MMTTVGVLNYGLNNLTSVLNAFSFLGVKTVIIEKKDDFKNCSHIVLPGVGNFTSAMRNLTQNGLDLAVIEEVKQGKPILGICLGMHLLLEKGEEGGAMRGLGLIKGTVKKMPQTTSDLKLPHMGWNEVQIAKQTKLQISKNNKVFYFAHSYFCDLDDQTIVTAYCQYGIEIPVILEKDNIFGVQFHPEKSHQEGIALLKRFIC